MKVLLLDRSAKLVRFWRWWCNSGGGRRCLMHHSNTSMPLAVGCRPSSISSESSRLPCICLAIGNMFTSQSKMVLVPHSFSPRSRTWRIAECKIIIHNFATSTALSKDRRNPSINMTSIAEPYIRVCVPEYGIGAADSERCTFHLSLSQARVLERNQAWVCSNRGSGSKRVSPRCQPDRKPPRSPRNRWTCPALHTWPPDGWLSRWTP